MGNPIKIGILGLGRQGWNMHLNGFGAFPDEFIPVAACDLLESRRQRAAERFPSCRVYGRMEDLLADPEVEMINIATYSKDHCAHALAALETGRHVYLEKPFCLSYEEAVCLRERAKQAEGKLFIGQNRRFEQDFIKLKEIIRSGILGDIYEIKHGVYNYARRDDWQTLKEFGGGQLYNWGPHLIDHALGLLESPIVSMASELRQIAASGDAEDHVRIHLKAENSRTADIEISGGVSIPSPKYVVYGTKGALHYQDSRFIIKYLDPGKPLPPRPVIRESGMDTFGSPEDLPWKEEEINCPIGDLNGIIHAVYKTLRCGEPFPVSMEEAVEVMRIITSAKKGRLEPKK